MIPPPAAGCGRPLAAGEGMSRRVVGTKSGVCHDHLHIALTCTVSNIMWSCHRHHENELRSLQAALIDSPFTADDEDKRGVPVPLERQAVTA